MSWAKWQKTEGIDKRMNLRKNIIRYLIMLSFILGGSFCANNVVAQEITAINFNGEPLGKVIPDGKVVSFDNRLLGNVTADSLIVDSKGQLIGGVVPQGVAIGNDAKFLGKVGNDGAVRSASGQVIGRSLPNGLVVNEYFDVLGQVIFPGLVYNDEGRVAGRVTGDGLYTSLDGQKIGLVTPDGYAYRGETGTDYVLDGRLISSKMVVSLTGDFVGSVVPGGLVTDFNSQIIGRIKANGFVYDEANKVIGKVVSSGYAFDNNGYYLGFVSYNGEVINENKVVGKLRADGFVVNVNGAISGRVVDFSSVATDMNGRYLGRLQPNGNLMKATTINGLIGARGIVNNASGLPIGALISTGPVFDYKGDLKGHAVSNGSVISLNGSTIGYMIGETAYNLSGIVIGSVLKPKAVFTSQSSFLGISGIGSQLDNKGSEIKISPLGYVFSLSGNIEGQALDIDAFYTPFGSVSSYMGLQGEPVNAKGTVLGRVIGNGYVVNPQNQLVAKNIPDSIAVNAKGESIGVMNNANFLLNKSLSAVGKILPDGSVTETKSSTDYMPKLGQAYTAVNALDFKGNLLGYADVLGSVNNMSNAKIGHMVERGLISDNNGIIIGYLMKHQGAIDDECNFLGVATAAGGVYNYRGVYVGKILENGQLISDSGAFLGYMSDEHPVIDFNGRIIGYGTYNGRVLNERGEYIGCLDRKRQLRNADKALIGKTIEFEPIINFEGEIIGSTVVNGLMVDSNNNLTGYQQPNGNVNSTSGLPIGALFKYKVAFGLDNKFMGYISNDNKVLDAAGKEVGKVDFDGYVISKGQKVGYALYDFYLYNQEGIAVGIINRNGEASSFANQSLGRFDRGFVLENGVVVARGNRDYLIRDNAHLVVGELQLNGNVVDNLGNIVGTLSEAGKIVNAEGETIALATPLQFYSSLTVKKGLRPLYDENGNLIGYIDENGNLVDANGNIIGRVDANGNILDADGNIIGKIGADGKSAEIHKKDDEKERMVENMGRDWFEKEELKIGAMEEVEPADENKEAEEFDREDKKYFKSLGIALTPDGEYLGEILEDDTVVDEDGNILGYRMPDGLIIDDEGNLIGTQEIEESQEDESGVFVPAGTFGPGGAYGVGEGPAGNLGPGGGYGPGERYDPTRKAALEAAMQERRQNISVGKISSGIRKESFDGYQKDWSEQGIPKSISSWRVDMSEMIFSDKPIPAVIARAIDTNNPAPITAYVERNVYAEEGRNIIIPAGSRLIGSFGSITAAAEATSESARVQISWERLIRPDGSIFVFNGQTADAQGRAGALGYVDQQLFKKYTLPVVTTVLTSAASYFIASADDAAGQVETSKQQAANDARQNFLDDMESLFDEILADKTDVKAMTYIPAGTRIIVYPNTDLWLRSVERDSEESQKYQKPEILIDDVKTGEANEAKAREDVAKSSGSSVVYNPDDANVEAAGAPPPVLINDVAPKKTNNIAPPPPPSSGTVPAAGTTPPVTTTTSTSAATSTNNSVPALF